MLPSSLCTCVGNGAPSSPLTISSCILNDVGVLTVNDLLSLVNHGLGGELPSTFAPCLTYSDIDSALDALNNSFDECKTVCDCGRSVSQSGREGPCPPCHTIITARCAHAPDG